MAFLALLTKFGPMVMNQAIPALMAMKVIWYYTRNLPLRYSNIFNYNPHNLKFTWYCREELHQAELLLLEEDLLREATDRQEEEAEEEEEEPHLKNIKNINLIVSSKWWHIDANNNYLLGDQ